MLTDDDNLAYAFKTPRDAVAFWLGCSDGPRETRLRWTYAQEVHRIEAARPSRRVAHRNRRKWKVWFRIELTQEVTHA